MEKMNEFYLNNNLNNNENIKILAVMARSFDYNQLNEKKIHLISSIFYMDNKYYKIDYTKLSNFLKNNEVNKYIIYLYLNDNITADSFSDDIKTIKISDNLIMYKINIILFLTKKDLFDEIIGKEPFRKDYNSILIDSLFVIDGISWDFFKLFFDILDIKISGGNYNNRHVLSSVQYSLSFFLLGLGAKSRDIYENFKTSQILNIHNRFNEKNKYIKYKEYVNDLMKKSDALYYGTLGIVVLKNIEGEIENLNKKIVSINEEIKKEEIKYEEESEILKYAFISPNRENIDKNKDKIRMIEEKIIRKKELKEKIKNNDLLLTIIELKSEYNIRQNYSRSIPQKTRIKNNYQIRSYSSVALSKDVNKNSINNNTNNNNNNNNNNKFKWLSLLCIFII